MPLISDPVSAVASAVQAIVERVIPDPVQQAQAKEQLAAMYMQGDLQQMASKAGIITAEANSTNWLTSSWRPMLMYVFMVIIANNYILEPYIQLFFHTGLVLQLPPDMWSLLKLGVGGYVVGRSIEKTATSVTGQGIIPNIVKAVMPRSDAAPVPVPQPPVVAPTPVVMAPPPQAPAPSFSLGAAVSNIFKE